METQGKELFSQIVEVVNTLQKATPSHSKGREDMSNDEHKVVKDVQKTGLEFDLNLPIDLPGLLPSAIKKESAKKDLSGYKKEETSSEVVSKMPRNKPKPTDSISKNGGGVSRLKTDGKSHVEVTKREKDNGSSKLVADAKKLQKPKKASDESTELSGKLARELAPVKTTELQEGKASGRLSAEPAEKTDPKKDSKVKVKEISEAKENLKVVEEESTVKLVGETSDIISKKSKFMGKAVESQAGGCIDGNDVSISPMPDGVKLATEFTENLENLICDSPIRDKEKDKFSLLEKAEIFSEDEQVKRRERKSKHLSSGKKSLRIASFSDDLKLEEESDHHESIRAKKHSNRNQKGETNLLSQKKAKAYLNSSSDESNGRSCSPEKMGTYISSSRLGSQKLSRRFDLDCSRRYSGDNRAKTLSRTVSPASTSSNASGCTVPLVDARQKHRKSKFSPHPSSRLNRDRSGSPIRSPTLVTRSNRHVKRNKRYYPSEEEELVEDMVEGGLEEKSTKRRKISRWS